MRGSLSHVCLEWFRHFWGMPLTSAGAEAAAEAKHPTKSTKDRATNIENLILRMMFMYLVRSGGLPEAFCKNVPKKNPKDQKQTSIFDVLNNFGSQACCLDNFCGWILYLFRASLLVGLRDPLGRIWELLWETFWDNFSNFFCRWCKSAKLQAV